MTRALGVIWSLPHTLVGLLLAVTAYRCRDWRWERGAITCVAGVRAGGVTRIWGRPGAQTHGIVIVFASETHREDARLMRHEIEHVCQGMRWGPLYVATYAGHFLWRWGFGLRMPWWDAYHGICWERWARRAEDDAHGPF